jgi:hypothetical protein
MVVAIYYDSYLFKDYIYKEIKFPQHITKHEYNIIEEYKSSTADLKIAFTTSRYAVDFEIDETSNHAGCPATNFNQRIVLLSDISDMVFSFDGEIHNHYYDIWKECDRTNIFWAIPGTVNFDSNLRSRVINYMDHFLTQANLYKREPQKELLKNLNYEIPKLKYFDALLGLKRQHRDFVFNLIQESGLVEKSITTYIGAGDNVPPNTDSEFFIWPTDIEFGADRTKEMFLQSFHTCNGVKYCDITVPLSKIIPIDIYNQTAYTIVAETNFDNGYSFYTEKTAKPMLARRLFVAFSGQYFLRNLREFGFRTFGDVIDESYDEIADHETRWTMAFEQVKKLCTLDQLQVYNKIKETLDHNYNLLNNNWLAVLASQIEKKIQNIIQPTQ